MLMRTGRRCGALCEDLAADSAPLTDAYHCVDYQTWSGSAFALHARMLFARSRHVEDAADDATIIDPRNPSTFVRQQRPKPLELLFDQPELG